MIAHQIWAHYKAQNIVTRWKESNPYPGPHKELIYPKRSLLFRRSDVFRRYCQRWDGLLLPRLYQCCRHSSKLSSNLFWMFQIPFKLLRNIVSSQSTKAEVLPFHFNANEDWLKIYSTPWDTDIYRLYDISMHTGQVVLVEVYSDGETMAKSGTQGSTYCQSIHEEVVRNRHRAKWLTDFQRNPRRNNVAALDATTPTFHFLLFQRNDPSNIKCIYHWC